MRTREILYAEDNVNDVELTLAALQECRLANQVHVARDGAEALDYLYGRGQFAGRAGPPPLLILLDLKMPKVDGLEVLRTVKGDPVLRAIPVVVLTSSAEDRDVRTAYELGANAYVVKPVDFAKLIEAVRHIRLFWLLTVTPPPAAGRSDADAAG